MRRIFPKLRMLSTLTSLLSIGAGRHESLRGGLGNEICGSHLKALMNRPICLMNNIHFGADACRSLTYAASGN